MLEILFTPEAILSLLTLTLMEIVLGIDNIVFISIICGKLPQEMQAKARNYGLVLALVPRVILLLFISWIIGMDKPLFTIGALKVHGEPFALTGKGLILLIGGLFLLYKATTEIHHKLEGEDEMDSPKAKKSSFSGALIQIILINIVFSFDSILTAVGLVSSDEPPKGFGIDGALIIMIIAVILSVVVMMLFAGPVSRFVNKHPTVKMLALSFLILIGVMLIVEAVEVHVPKGYVYFAMAFSVIVEMLNLRLRKKTQPVNLHDSYALKNLKEPDTRTTPRDGAKP
jgi:predicted tellurium resistance membrane protein TerC